MLAYAKAQYIILKLYYNNSIPLKLPFFGKTPGAMQRVILKLGVFYYSTLSNTS
jgi:hypothetical protein